MSDILKPKKNRFSRFKRGSQVPCFILSPGEKISVLKYLRKEENLLSNRNENQSFLITASPALEILHDNKIYPCYVCDAEKGVTVALDWERDTGLTNLFCDPKLVSNVFDETFISKASGIKPDIKQLLGLGFFAFIFGGVVGLLF